MRRVFGSTLFSCWLAILLPAVPVFGQDQAGEQPAAAGQGADQAQGAPGGQPGNEAGGAPGTGDDAAGGPLLQDRPADATGDDYDWDRPNPWSRRPRDRTEPPLTQEDLRRPNLEKMRDDQGRVALRYARELAAAGSTEQALDRYRNFLVLYPRHEWRLNALLGTADLLLQLDRIEQAIGYYEQAYRDAPDRERGALAYLRAGKLYAEMGRFEDARRIFTQLTGRKPASRVARLATIELKSLGFLDSKTDSLKTGGSENSSPTPAEAPRSPEPQPAPETGEAEGTGDRNGQTAPPPAPARQPGAESTIRDALDRMGEGVEEL